MIIYREHRIVNLNRVKHVSFKMADNPSADKFIFVYDGYGDDDNLTIERDMVSGATWSRLEDMFNKVRIK